jgi:predicted CXXCH cytochrome family protein
MPGPQIGQSQESQNPREKREPVAALARCALSLGLASWLLGCAADSRPRGGDSRPVASQPQKVESNILRADYVGSAACKSCHQEVYERWQRSPMHLMTRDATPANIRAPFDGTTFRVGADSVTLTQRGEHRFMHLVSAKQGERTYRVSRVIGGRYREDFAGIELQDGLDASASARGSELVLPVSYVFGTASLRYKGYSVLLPERAGMQAGPIWSAACAVCHNTLPYFSTIYDDLLGDGAESYQGSISDDLLPPSSRRSFAVRDRASARRALVDELAFLGREPEAASGSLEEVLLETLRVTRRELHGGHLVEVGIGCEACHGGAREHIADPSVRPSFEVRSRFLEAGVASGKAESHAASLNRSCARCHTVLFSRYPFTWEGGRRSDPVPGGSSMNSGEARDFLLGGCANALTCTTCHDPHAEDDRSRLAELESVRGNHVCQSCHDDLRSDEAVRAHTRHRVDGPGSACVACHMPRKNMGLDYELTRYHRIGSPTDPERVLRDRPLECALCHADWSVEAIVGRMERFWSQRYDRAALRRLYGDDLSVSALDATLERGEAHEQAVAIGVFGEQRVARAVPALARELAHEYPLVRFFAKHSIERITGEAVPIDPNRSATEIEVDTARWLEKRSPP